MLLSNGAYGERMKSMCEYHQIAYQILNTPYNQTPSATDVMNCLASDERITHVAMVHSETTTGILNGLKSIGAVVQKYHKIFIVDAMSSFGGMRIPVKEYGIDYLISSSNKCIQGVPGFSFIICRQENLIRSQRIARSLSLDLYDQWKVMSEDGKWRYTSPTHVVLAFQQAIKELKAEGGIQARNKRYCENMNNLIRGFAEIGLNSYLSEELQGPIIATFHYPENDFSFNEMYDFVKERGYAIYPGKLMNMATFRVGVIGEIYPEDIEKLITIMDSYFQKKKEKNVI